MTAKEYIGLAEKVHDLIMEEMKWWEDGKGDLIAAYPKLAVMCEFFRMLRGEAFSEVRPPTPGEQDKLYAMEDEISKALDRIKEKVELDDERLKYQVEQMWASYLE